MSGLQVPENMGIWKVAFFRKFSKLCKTNIDKKKRSIKCSILLLCHSWNAEPSKEGWNRWLDRTGHEREKSWKPKCFVNWAHSLTVCLITGLSIDLYLYKREWGSKQLWNGKVLDRIQHHGHPWWTVSLVMKVWPKHKTVHISCPVIKGEISQCHASFAFRFLKMDFI